MGDVPHVLTFMFLLVSGLITGWKVTGRKPRPAPAPPQRGPQPHPRAFSNPIPPITRPNPDLRLSKLLADVPEPANGLMNAIASGLISPDTARNLERKRLVSWGGDVIRPYDRRYW